MGVREIEVNKGQYLRRYLRRFLRRGVVPLGLHSLMLG
jgi:hypothetical protein